MADYTTTELIAKLKKRGMIPTSQDTFQNEDFLRFLNDELLFYIVPFVMSLREEFFVTYADETIGSSSAFDIPSRATGVKLRDLEVITTNGDVNSIPRIEPEDREQWSDSSRNDAGFYLRNDQIILLGNYNSTDSLRKHYFRRANELVLQSACALVSSVSGNDITCSSMPTSWDIDDTFDVIKGSQHFRSRGDDQTITAIDTSAKTLTFTDAPDGIAAGDWICLAGQSPIAQIPYDCFPLLVYKTAAEIIRSNGDHEAAKVKDAAVEKIEKYLLGMLSDRVEGENRKLVNNENFAVRNAI